MSVQVIQKNGKPEWAVLPYEEYERLVEEAEMLQDVRAYDEAKKAVAAGEELVPSEVTYAGLTLEDVVDVPGQQVRVAFLPLGESNVELVQPTSDDTGVARFLEKRGEGIHHVCIQVDAIEAALEPFGGLES